MYDKMNNDAGVLNDFDLANVRVSERHGGTERMGTMPFMALDLLSEDALANDCTVPPRLRVIRVGSTMDLLSIR